MKSSITIALAILASSALVACKSGGGGGSTPNDNSSNPFGGGPAVEASGILVDDTIKRTIEAASAGTPSAQFCSELSQKYEFNGEYQIEYVKIENGQVASCPHGNNWNSQCEVFGTYTGNTFSFEADGEKLTLSITEESANTYRFTGMTENGEAKDISHHFENEESRLIHKVSSSQIDVFNRVLVDCGVN